MFENFDKKYLKDVGLSVLKVLLGVGVLAYFGYQAWHYTTVNVRCEPAMAYTVAEKSSGEGCVFRNESPIASSGGGSLVSSVDTGTRVGIGDEVARIYTASSIDVEKRLEEIEAQINLLSASVYSQSVTNRDVSKLDAEVYDTVTDMSRSVADGAFSDALAYRSSFISTVNRRSVASGSTIDFASQIAALQSEKSSLTGQLGALRSTITAPAAGWYYPECDGYENIFTVDEIKNLTYDGFRTLASASPSSGTNAGKVVLDCKWYFVCEMSMDSLKTKTVGDEYTLYFPYNRNEKVVMTLEKICEGADGFGAAVFSSYKMPGGFDYLRMQSYELMETEYTGFRIPRSAVRIVDGQMGVYILSGEVVRFRKIDVLTEYENGYIVKMDHGEKDEEQEAQAAESTKTETSSDSGSADTDKASDDDFDAASCPWLGANENVIVSGKGMRDGRIITTAG